MDEQINKPVDTTTAAPENTTPLAQQPVTATQQPTTATQAPQSSIPLTSSVTARPAENLPAGVSDYSAEIAQLYDAQMAAQAQALETAYNQNLEAANYAKSQIDPAFNKQGNDLATQYERTRRNNNLRADMNGLNTGAASQMDLAQQSNFLDAFGKVRAAQAQATTEADRQIANLEIAYKSQVAQALAQNDYQKAAALMQEYQRRDNAAEEMRRYNQAQAEQDAKIKAAYGDFSGYASLYGQDTANAMKQFWAMNNPDYAYSMGMITAAQYEQMTGYSPDRSSLYSGGYSSGGSSGSSGGYRRSSRGSNNNPSNNPNGPGSIDGQNPIAATSEPLSERDAYNADRAALLADIDRYGSEKGAYVARMQNQQMAAQGQAEMAAVANGLKPGTTAYRTFVAEQKNYILSTDADYIANQKAVNALGEQQKLEEQKKQAAFEAQYGKAGAVSYDYNAQQSAADSEKAFASASTYTPTPAKNTSKNSNVTSASSQAGKEIRAKGGSGGNTTTSKNANKTR